MNPRKYSNNRTANLPKIVSAQALCYDAKSYLQLSYNAGVCLLCRSILGDNIINNFSFRINNNIGFGISINNNSYWISSIIKINDDISEGTGDTAGSTEGY
jgi:hypothetical protein